MSIDRSSAAPGSRSSAPSTAGGGRAVVTQADAPALLDDSTRRREDLDADATVNRSGLRAGGRRAGMPSRTRRSRRAPDLVPALVVGLALLCVVVAALALAAEPTPAGTGVGSAPARWVSAALLLAGAVVVTMAVPRDRPHFERRAS